jgi:hypothetical protein
MAGRSFRLASVTNGIQKLFAYARVPATLDSPIVGDVPFLQQLTGWSPMSEYAFLSTFLCKILLSHSCLTVNIGFLTLRFTPSILNFDGEPMRAVHQNWPFGPIKGVKKNKNYVLQP